MGHPASGPDMITATPKSRIRFFGRKSKFVNSFYKLHASLHQGQLAKSAIHRTSIERFTHVVTSTDRLLKWCDSQLPSGPHFRLGLMIYWIFILKEHCPSYESFFAMYKITFKLKETSK
jgi:hypothetical protein